MTGIPPAAAQTIRTAVADTAQAHPGHPDAITHRITRALADAGWQITPAPVEDPEDTPAAP